MVLALTLTLVLVLTLALAPSGMISKKGVLYFCPSTVLLLLLLQAIVHKEGRVDPASMAFKRQGAEAALGVPQLSRAISRSCQNYMS